MGHKFDYYQIKNHLGMIRAKKPLWSVNESYGTSEFSLKNNSKSDVLKNQEQPH